jgi:hypothetical protein
MGKGIIAFLRKGKKFNDKQVNDTGSVSQWLPVV